MSELIQMTNVRLSFPKLIEAVAPNTPPNAAKKFGADLIMAPNHPDYARFMAEVGQGATAAWKEQAGPILQMLQNDRRLRCWGNGNEKIKKDTLKPYNGYEGMIYLTTSMNEDRPPIMIRADGTECDNGNTMERTALARKLYGGCYVNVAVSPWIQDNQFGRAVRCNLVAVQFAKDGEPFGEGTPNVTGMFGAVAQPAPVPATTLPPWL
jgi:hypothetical protein